MSKSLVDVVYGEIILRILRGEYNPGDTINRRAVASSLSVSISPVSEAFALLQSEEIIINTPRKGTFINKLDWRDLWDLIEVRVALESQAARKYCGEIISQHKKELVEMALKVDKMTPMTYEHMIADIYFHRRLTNLANNKILSSLFDRVITRSLLLAMEATMSLMKNADTGRPHERLVIDLCNADIQEVDSIIRDNILGSKVHLMNELYANPGFQNDMENDTNKNELEKSLVFILNNIGKNK